MNSIDACIVAMKQIAPLESELVGDRALRHIANRREVSETHGGRHIDLGASITILASIVTVVDFAIRLRQSISRSSTVVTSEELAKQIRSSLAQLPIDDSQMSDVITQASEIVARLDINE